MQPKDTTYNSNSFIPLKAEAFCNALLTSGISLEHIHITYAGGFRKSYRNDIEKVEHNYNDELKQFIVDLVINRDGIYDRLPAGIFHQSRGNYQTLTVDAMVEEYRRFKEEEKHVRRFFRPIEEEIFRFSSMVHQKECDLAFSMLKGNLENELVHFWDIPKDIAKEPSEVFVSIMPWVDTIKGNRALTAKTLELMLCKPVLSKEYSNMDNESDSSFMLLGDGLLGVDTVIGQTFVEPSLCWQFTIEQIARSEIASYLDDKELGKFLKHFEEVFIPLTVDVSFHFNLMEEEDTDVKAEAILGYSLMI